MICKTCKKDLPDSDFYTYPKRTDCKVCYQATRTRTIERAQARREREKNPVEKIAPLPFLLHKAWRKVATCNGVRYTPGMEVSYDS
jgi:hypothetical protein